MPGVKAFLSLEASVERTLDSGGKDQAAKLQDQVETLIEEGRFGEAHYLVDHAPLKGAVSDNRERLEELAVSALLFGAHNAAGKLADTSYVAKDKPLPYEIQEAVNQLQVMVEDNGAELVRDALHEVIYEEELLHQATLLKDDLGSGDLAAGGGLQNPEQLQLSRETLYVHRQLANPDAILEWAKAQGFNMTLPAYDFHVTVAFSKRPVDWSQFSPNVGSVTASGGKRAIHRFGDAIVLTFESEDLQDRWQEFRDGGASWDFDEYRPHVTISYDPDLDISGIEPFTGDLEFDLEVFAPVNPNWSAQLVEVALRKAEMTLTQRLNDAVMNNRRLMASVGANLTTSRLVTFGFLAEAGEQAITHYQVNEVLDDVTCPVCEYMHGKTFSVETEYGRVLSALKTQDPAQLKSIAPWPRQTKEGLRELNGMSPEELQAAGYGSPPFHPGCRGMLTIVGSVQETIPLGEMEITDAAPIAARRRRVPPVVEVVDEPITIVPVGGSWTALIDKLRSQAVRERALRALAQHDYALLQEILSDNGVL